jgi:hypothetical protein
MNPTLIDPSVTPLPAPVWFIQLFKVLGLSLHMAPMNLWYAGIILAMLLHMIGSQHGRRFSARLMSQMPVIVAMGVNLGIVPLLFVQVGYAKIFYPATILMAWFWLAIIGALIPAYYGVYVYAFGLGEAGGKMKPWKRLAGWLAAALFLWIGFTFANAMSLMENVGGWGKLWTDHGADGAALGTALNLADSRLWPRWLLMFGLALTTTAVWVYFDAAWFARREGPEYRAWAKRFSLKLYTAGMIWFAAAGSWYVFRTWSPEVFKSMFQRPWVPLTVATAIAPGAVWLLLWRAQRGVEAARGAASLVALVQFAVLGVNAVSRQVVQNFELSAIANFSITKQPEAVQWSPLVLFLAVFVLGLAVVAWMIAQVAKLPAEKKGDILLLEE